MALQVQFYAAFPLLLCALRPRVPGFRARVAAALAAVVAAGTAWRLWLVSSAGPALHLPLGDLAQPAELDSYITLLETSYFPTGPRVAELALGAALGLLLRSHGAVSWLLRRRGLVAAAAISLQAAFVHLSLHWHPHGLPGAPLWQPRTAQLYAALLYWGSPFIALLVSVTLLALMLHSDPLHSALASALGAPLFQPLSNLSYCLYLLHEPARLWGMLLLLPAGLLPALMAAAPVPALLLLTAFTLACGYAAAYLMHHLVEKRF
jgi:peptidoglycan/LPS O-acetylase OafA/YrhL